MIALQVASSVAEIETILKDPEIFERIKEDGLLIEDYIISMDDNQLYLMIYDDKTPIGVYHLHPTNGSTLVLHCNILSEYREHANIAGCMLWDWVLAEMPKRFTKIIAEIPVTYPEVYHHGKHFGFQDEGINRASIKKNGEYVDQWHIGITLEEIRAWVQQQH